MTPDQLNGIAEGLSRFHPAWVAFIVAVAILCYKLPDIIRALRETKAR